MLFTGHDDSLNPARGIVNAILLGVYLGVALALAVLMWAVVS